MNCIIRKSFEKDALKLPLPVQKEISVIIDKLMMSERLSDIQHCKKLSGYKNAYRIKSGNYRIGFFFENGNIELIRVLARKDMYRYFP